MLFWKKRPPPKNEPDMPIVTVDETGKSHAKDQIWRSQNPPT